MAQTEQLPFMQNAELHAIYNRAMDKSGLQPVQTIVQDIQTYAAAAQHQKDRENVAQLAAVVLNHALDSVKTEDEIKPALPLLLVATGREDTIVGGAAHTLNVEEKAVALIANGKEPDLLGLGGWAVKKYLQSQTSSTIGDQIYQTGQALKTSYQLATDNLGDFDGEIRQQLALALNQDTIAQRANAVEAFQAGKHLNGLVAALQIMPAASAAATLKAPPLEKIIPSFGNNFNDALVEGDMATFDGQAAINKARAGKNNVPFSLGAVANQAQGTGAEVAGAAEGSEGAVPKGHYETVPVQAAAYQAEVKALGANAELSAAAGQLLKDFPEKTTIAQFPLAGEEGTSLLQTINAKGETMHAKIWEAAEGKAAQNISMDRAAFYKELSEDLISKQGLGTKVQSIHITDVNSNAVGKPPANAIVALTKDGKMNYVQVAEDQYGLPAVTPIEPQKAADVLDAHSQHQFLVGDNGRLTAKINRTQIVADLAALNPVNQFSPEIQKWVNESFPHERVTGFKFELSDSQAYTIEVKPSVEAIANGDKTRYFAAYEPEGIERIVANRIEHGPFYNRLADRLIYDKNYADVKSVPLFGTAIKGAMPEELLVAKTADNQLEILHLKQNAAGHPTITTIDRNQAITMMDNNINKRSEDYVKEILKANKNEFVQNLEQFADEIRHTQNQADMQQ